MMQRYRLTYAGTARPKRPFTSRLAAVVLAVVTVAVVCWPPTTAQALSEATDYPFEMVPFDRPSLRSEAMAASRMMQAQYVILISIDGLRPDAITALGAGQAPNFYRFRNEGVWTDNARTDFDYSVTLPNHTTELTARRVTTGVGHNWNSNTDPAPNETIHSNKGSYVGSVFDVAHDNSLRTAVYASKSKFILFDRSYDATHGAPDTTDPDDGQDKIDDYRFDSDSDDLTADFISAMQADPFHFGFLHLRDPDSAGHSSGWNITPGSSYSNAVKDMDGLLGDLFDLVENDPVLDGNTVIIMTSDHGGTGTGHSNPATPGHYTIPFYVWGAGVARGSDLYVLNPGTRLDPGTGRPTYSASPQPVRNGDVANLALSLLGLSDVPGSTINTTEKLAVNGAGNQLPIARFTATPSSGDLPLPVSFDASASFDPDGTLTGYAWDFGDGTSDSGVTANHTYTAAGNYVVTLMVTDNDGATDTDTAFITVTDPSTVTLSFQDGVAPTHGYNGTRDTKIKSDAQNTNFGSDDELEVDGSPDYSTMLRWDLSSLPTGSTVFSAEITLEIFNTSSDSYEIYEMKQDWVEDEATWNQYRNGSAWQTDGAKGAPDRGSDVLGTVIATSTGSLTIRLNATAEALIEAWIDNPSVNHGFILQDYTNASDGIDFDSRETITPGDRPKLTLILPTILYVATTGNDAGNDCKNPLTPCATLAYAVSQANDGDIINLAAGTYNESGLVIEKKLIIQGQGGVVQ